MYLRRFWEECAEASGPTDESALAAPLRGPWHSIVGSDLIYLHEMHIPLLHTLRHRAAAETALWDDDATGEPFTIAMPPPNVTGALHMGHAMFVTIQDIMARNARMRGRPTLWLPGTDHAGIATQLVVERSLEAEGLTREGVGRDEFERRTWEWKKEYGGRIGNQIRRLGASCDWSRERFTLDEGLSESVLEAFVTLHEKGLIYKGTYMVNWAPKLQTAVSDLEVEYADEPGTLYYFKYPVEGGGADDYSVRSLRFGGNA